MATRPDDDYSSRMTQTSTNDYARIEQAIHFLANRVAEQPTLADVSAEVGLSPHHLQRVFKRWAGVSPKRLLQLLTVEHAKELLDRSASVLDATYELGLTSPARLHDHFVALEAVTPGEYKERGKDLVIRYGFHVSPFGRMFLAATDRGVCRISFPSEQETSDEVKRLRSLWSRGRVMEDHQATASLAERVFEAGESRNGEPLRLVVRGTNFQTAVWRALLEIPRGRVATYSEIAQRVDRPRAVRAVGNAVGANQVAFLIPCHRVIRQLGGLGGYRWGTARKQALLAWESARATAA